MKYLVNIVVVVLVLVALLLATSPRLRCQATLGTWVPLHQVQTITPGEDTYYPIYRFRAARCLY